MRNPVKYSQKLEEILKSSASLFSEKGFHHASIRDISRITDMSLAGLYHYFKSKEEILFMIQDHAFGTILEKLQEGLLSISEPEEKLRFLIRNHLEYFINHMDELKVCAHDMETLQGEFYEEVADKRREYFLIARGIIEEISQKRPTQLLDLRVVTLQLFGNLNWVYMWYNPKIDQPAETLARIMADIFLHGIIGALERDCLGKSGMMPGRANSDDPDERKIFQ